MQITFDDLESSARKTTEQRRDFWTKTKRLQHGTLVCLLLPPSMQAGGAEEERLVFATISQRDVDRLAPRNPPADFRPSIGIRCCHVPQPSCWSLCFVSSGCFMLLLTPFYAAAWGLD